MPSKTSTGSSKTQVRSTSNYQGVDLSQRFATVDRVAGYRNREDKTMVSPNWMLAGSQNVLMDITGRLKSRKGYTLDGQANTTLDPIRGFFDWEERRGGIMNLRSHSGKIEFRYDNAGVVTWIPIYTVIGTTNPVIFCNYWNQAETENVLLIADGTTHLYTWNGALATIASYTPATQTVMFAAGASVTDMALASTATSTVFTNGLLADNYKAAIYLPSNPTDGQTITYTVNSTPITMTFVSSIGTTPGNVLIGATIDNTTTNLLGLLQHPGTTNTTQVALSSGDQTLVGYSTYSKSATLTKQGTTTWSDEMFYQASNRVVNIRGVDYAYLYGMTSTTLIGVTPDPGAQGANIPQAGDLTYQQVVAYNSSDITSLPSTYAISSVSNLGNQIYYGSTASNVIYISNVNDFKSVAYSTPRAAGEGGLATLRGPFVAFAPQEDSMYVSYGKSMWLQIKRVINANNQAYETFDPQPLKTSQMQGAVNQYAVSHDRNSIVYISNEARINALGRVDNIYQTPMISDYSYPIAKDVLDSDWTNSWVKFMKSYIYVGAPAQGKLFILNMTDPKNVFWEAPQTGAFGGAYMVNGNIYLHDYNVPQSYKWLDGYSDLGNPILSRAVFPYYNYGSKGITKYFNEYWVDGYINNNTNLAMTWNYDLDGCETKVDKLIRGNDSQIVCAFRNNSSLGKVDLGKKGLGTSLTNVGADPLPPYFNVIKVGVRKDFYFFSVAFESYGTDYHWELLSFGPLVQNTMYGNNAIKQD